MKPYEILAVYKLDKRYFTQGLEFINETHFILSEGLFGGNSATHIMHISKPYDAES